MLPLPVCELCVKLRQPHTQCVFLVSRAHLSSQQLSSALVQTASHPGINRWRRCVVVSFPCFIQSRFPCCSAEQGRKCCWQSVLQIFALKHVHDIISTLGEAAARCRRRHRVTATRRWKLQGIAVGYQEARAGKANGSCDRRRAYTAFD